MYVYPGRGSNHGRTLGIYNRLIESNWDEIIFTALVEIFIIYIHTVCCVVMFIRSTEYKIDTVEKP